MRLVAAIAFTVFGCSAEPAVLAHTCYAALPELSSTVYVSDRFDTETISAVSDAVEEWQAKTNGRATFELVVGAAPSGANTIEPGESCVAGNRLQIAVSGVAEFARPPMRAIVAHELGHAFGLRHTRGGLMDPRVASDRVDESAVSAFCASRGCQ